MSEPNEPNTKRQAFILPRPTDFVLPFRGRELPWLSLRQFMTLTVIAALIGVTPSLRAQDRASLSGRVTDSTSGAPVVGALLFARCPGCYGRHPTDSGGRYRLVPLPPGTIRIEANCPSATGLGAQIIDTSVTIAAGADVVLDVRVPPGRCLEPAYSERRGIFRGYWTPGFESSKFVPCADSALGISAPLLPGKRVVAPYAWADLAANAWGAGIKEPKKAPRDAWGNSTYFVVWRGVLKGPGQYGHMGVSAFSMVVDSMISVAANGPPGCRTR